MDFCFHRTLVLYVGANLLHRSLWTLWYVGQCRSEMPGRRKLPRSKWFKAMFLIYVEWIHIITLISISYSQNIKFIFIFYCMQIWKGILRKKLFVLLCIDAMAWIWYKKWKGSHFLWVNCQHFLVRIKWKKRIFVQICIRLQNSFIFMYSIKERCQ